MLVILVVALWLAGLVVVAGISISISGAHMASAGGAGIASSSSGALVRFSSIVLRFWFSAVGGEIDRLSWLVQWHLAGGSRLAVGRPCWQLGGIFISI